MLKITLLQHKITLQYYNKIKCNLLHPWLSVISTTDSGITGAKYFSVNSVAFSSLTADWIIRQNILHWSQLGKFWHNFLSSLFSTLARTTTYLRAWLQVHLQVQDPDEFMFCQLTGLPVFSTQSRATKKKGAAPGNFGLLANSLAHHLWQLCERIQCPWSLLYLFVPNILLHNGPSTCLHTYNVTCTKSNKKGSKLVGKSLFLSDNQHTCPLDNLSHLT